MTKKKVGIQLLIITQRQKQDLMILQQILIAYTMDG